MLRCCVLMAVCLSLPQTVRPAPDVWSAVLPGEEDHPCLMLHESDIPRVRERLSRPPYSDWWRSIQASGDMVSQAFVWLMTGDTAKAEAARTQLLKCYPTGYHCCCGVADALQGVAEAYDLLHDYPGLSPTDHRVIRAKIADACERLYLSALGTGPGQHPGNQRTRGICALGTAALALSGYQDAAHTPREWLQRALDGLHQAANLEFWREDGMFIEGPAYSAFTLSVMIPFARYFHLNSGKWLFADPRLRNALLYLIHVTQPDGLCAAMGTTNMYNVVAELRLCVGAGDPAEQGLIRWALAQWGSLNGGTVRDLCLFDDAVPPATGPFSPVRFFPVSQEASVRNYWGGHSVALWFKGKDPWLAATHPVYSHGDVGSFVLHAYGELLGVDAGYDHWVSYNLYPPELHNTLLVDGKGPVMGTPGLLENMVDARFLQAGDIVSDYQGIHHRRSFLFVDDGYVAIADDIRADGEHQYDWQIHTPVGRPDGQVQVQGNRAFWTSYDPGGRLPGSVGLQAVWADPVEVLPVETSRWQPFGDDPKTASFDNWALVARQRAANARYLTVLCPHPLSQPPPSVETAQVADARCLIVDGGTDRDTLITTDGTAVTVGSLTTSLSTCLVRAREKTPIWAYLAGTGRLENEGLLVAGIEGHGNPAVVVQWAEAPGARNAVHLWICGPAGTRVTIPTSSRTFNAFRASEAGPWEPCELAQHDTLASVVLQADARQAARYVVQPASDPPPVAAGPTPRPVVLVVDGQGRQAVERLDLGRVAALPREIKITFDCPGAPPDAERTRVYLDGVRVPDVLWRRETAESKMEVAVTLPGELPPAVHELVACVTDRSGATGQSLVRFSSRPLISNGGFELGGEKPRDWSLGTWSGDETTRCDIRAVNDRPHSGRWCLKIEGLAGPLNMVAAQRVEVEFGKTYVLSGFYRGQVPASASFCSASGRGQYIWSPQLGPSEDWAPFSWEFTVENLEPTLLVALRSGSVGAVYFDDVSLVPRP